MTSVTIIGTFVSGVVLGFNWQMWLEQTQPTKQTLNKLNKRIMIVGIIAFVGSFLPIISPFASSLFGITFGLIYLNKRFENK